MSVSACMKSWTPRLSQDCNHSNAHLVLCFSRLQDLFLCTRRTALSVDESIVIPYPLCAEVHDDELLKELPAQLRTAIVAHVLRGVFDTSHLFAVRHSPSSSCSPVLSMCAYICSADWHLHSIFIPEGPLHGHDILNADCGERGRERPPM